VNLQDLGAVGELVGAVAVLVTVIYLAIQIRQNTEMMRHTATQSATAMAREITALVMNTPGLAANRENNGSFPVLPAVRKQLA